MSKPHSVSTFQETWFTNEKYSLWISKDTNNTSKASCKLCHKVIDLKCGGATALDSHRKGKKHQELEKARTSNSIELFLNKSKTSNQNDGSSSSQLSSTSEKVGPKEPQTGQISMYIVDENTLNAEIIWCLNVVKSHHSFRSCAPLKNIFKVMFPDSRIPEKFTLGKDKIRYLKGIN